MEKIYNMIAEVEESSAAELVVIRGKMSSTYRDVPLVVGVVAAFVVYFVLMIIPQEVDPYIMFIYVLIAFFVGTLLVMFVPALKGKLISQKRKLKMVEIYARALFQKGGIHLTKKNIGIMLFCSDLEKTAYLVVDNGVEIKVPESELEKVNKLLQDIYKTSDFDNNVINALKALKSVLETYLPNEGEKINEIPDDLKINL